MDWLLENLRIFVFLAIIVVWIVRSIAGRNKAEGEDAPPASAGDPSVAERTRQIQEEIRRRILARQRGETLAPAPPEPSPPVVVYQESRHEAPEVMEEEYLEEGPRTPMPTAAARREADAAQAAILEQQRSLADQLHALRVARSAGGNVTTRTASSLPRDAAVTVAEHQRGCRRELLRDLHHPASLRRAVLLKEILGEPIALRRNWQLPRR